MSGAGRAGLAVLGGLAVGAALGYGLAPTGPAPEPAPVRTPDRTPGPGAVERELQKRIDALAAERESLRSEVARLRAAEAARAAVPPRGGPAPLPAGGVVADRTRTAKDLEDAARKAIAGRDARGAFTALRGLAGLGDEGRTAAVALLAELLDLDRLDADDAAWSALLADPAVTALLAWTIENPAPEGVREVAAEELPSLQPPTVVIPRFRARLLVEKDEDVQRAMVEGLAGLDGPEPRRTLLELLGDARAPIPVRVHVATHIAGWEAPEAAKALRDALEGAPRGLAEGIRAALASREPAATGFLITGFVGGSVESRGLAAGDLLLTYDGRSAAEELNRAIRDALGRDGFVRVEFLRDGTLRTEELRPGWLGLIGRVVRR